MPGQGANWQSYWTILKSNDSRPANATWAIGTRFRVIGNLCRRSPNGTLSTTPSKRYWTSPRNVRFGAMTYGDNNHGGKIVFDVADLSSGTNLTDFEAAIPGPDIMVTVSRTGNRSSRVRPPVPRPRRLFDAGHYFGAGSYPA